jgi:hypothetical protein
MRLGGVVGIAIEAAKQRYNTASFARSIPRPTTNLVIRNSLGLCFATVPGALAMTNPGARKVKVGVVGCGVVATAYYLPYLANMDTVDLVTVCDRFRHARRPARACLAPKSSIWTMTR